MTEQDLFTKAFLGVVKQGAPAMVRTNCKYRTPEGLKCAVGHVLTDEEYHPHMENLDVEGLEISNLLPERLKPHVAFLARLQEIHDSTAELKDFTRHFINEMECLAAEYGLEMPVHD